MKHVPSDHSRRHPECIVCLSAPRTCGACDLAVHVGDPRAGQEHAPILPHALFCTRSLGFVHVRSTSPAVNRDGVGRAAHEWPSKSHARLALSGLGVDALGVRSRASRRHTLARAPLGCAPHMQEPPTSRLV